MEPKGALAGETSRALTARTAFDAFYDAWLPRTYGYAAAQLGDPARAEAVTRAALRRALLAGIALGGEAAIGRQLLALLKAELATEQRRAPLRAGAGSPSTQAQRRA
ncbi:MAG TPA: hypothetical protein VFT98_08335 [Myxococcota bacterium]|nr:hypothetical protein [Myxococcota bacterium]